MIHRRGLDPGDPVRWTAPMMCHCQDLDPTFRFPIDDREGESSHASPADIGLAVDRTMKWMFAYPLQHLLELGKIPGAQSGSSGLVPGDRFKMLCFRFGMKPMRHRSRARALRRTSSAGTGRTSPRSSSRARRSASESQVSASSSSDGLSRLSSSFRASDARSSGGSFKAASCRVWCFTILSFSDSWISLVIDGSYRGVGEDHSGIGLLRRGMYSMSGALPPAAIRYWAASARAARKSSPVWRSNSRWMRSRVSRSSRIV